MSDKSHTFPRTLPAAETEMGKADYLLQDQLFAMRSRHGIEGAEVVAKLSESSAPPIFVYRRSALVDLSHVEGELLPVYSTVQDGPVAVPTGRVFIRVSPELTIEAERTPIENAGYRIVQIPGYAPHTAWIEPVARGVAHAIARLNQLRQLPRIANVELQMLRERAQRPRPSRPAKP